MSDHYTVNRLIRDVQQLRALGVEEIQGVAVIDGQPVRFAVIACNEGEEGQLVLELEQRTVATRRV